MTKKLLWAPLFLLLGVFAAAQAATVPVAGKIIALDAGHGGGDTGAINIKTGVREADVNWDVVQALKTKLEALGAHVVVADRLSTRKARVDGAATKCAALDLNNDNAADGRKCDILVSVHHNGSSDPTHGIHSPASRYLLQREFEGIQGSVGLVYRESGNTRGE